MDITKTIRGEFVATKGEVFRYDVYDDKIIAHLRLYKDAEAQAEGCICDDPSYVIEDKTGFNGSKIWVESKIPSNLDPVEEEQE